MTRPEKVYLESPIEIDGTRIGHTYEGLKYLIDHYTLTMNNATPQQLNIDNRQHCATMIENLRLRVALYEKRFNNQNKIEQ